MGIKYSYKKFLKTIGKWRKEEEEKMDKAETEQDHKFYEGRITMIDDMEALYKEDEEPDSCP